MNKEEALFGESIDEKLRPSVERALFGKTSEDNKIDLLPIPRKPVMIFISIKLIRYYRSHISPRLGNRCVFDPSCSRYAEQVLRKYGFIRGVIKTISRLYRCRPGNGGIDMP